MGKKQLEYVEQALLNLKDLKELKNWYRNYGNSLLKEDNGREVKEVVTFLNQIISKEKAFSHLVLDGIAENLLRNDEDEKRNLILAFHYLTEEKGVFTPAKISNENSEILVNECDFFDIFVKSIENRNNLEEIKYDDLSGAEL